ncbi:division/cell wall cluster transcriptional repressor MraZ [Oryzomicrobium sp.]|uniref:division/cell wall cluster transcriptional repressor MraZ n=1 Tax=Oryzomicrobium sp. TaxID=1911578 RepID=UPI0025D5197F|nr:division/cell wall cluster transcriptional repressor MraZ [Oryzomicrobium sp.]MCE1241604.1 division/cell wall cluster transcriptional repressor MraZ [Oryzomicrobium sp.]
MFQGTVSISLDAKGRLAIPARHREALAQASAGGLVLTAHPHGCLLLYPLQAWEPIRDQILKAPSFDPRSAALKRVLVGNAREEEMDSAGRLLIAPELRGHAKLEKQVWMVGMGSHFEIWSDEGWQAQNAAALAALQSDVPPPGFEAISL